MKEFPFEDNHPDYARLTLKMVHHKISDQDLNLRVYFGASPINPIYGMYSFSPAKQVSLGGSCGFPRLPLRDMKYITNNLNSAPRISNVSVNESRDFFEELVYINRQNGLVEGFNFQYEKESHPK